MQVVKKISDGFASESLRDGADLANRLAKGETVVNFAYTDYGGDFFDKVAIAYFKEKYPDNIVSETTSYSGENGLLFGDVAKEFLEEFQRYPLGFEDMEELYSKMQSEQEDESFKFFVDDELKGKYEYDEQKVMDWLRENKGGMYHIEPNALDFSYSELIKDLEEAGMIKPKSEEQMESVLNTQLVLLEKCLGLLKENKVQWSDTGRAQELLDALVEKLQKLPKYINAEAVVPDDYSFNGGEDELDKPITISSFFKSLEIYRDNLVRLINNAGKYSSESIKEDKTEDEEVNQVLADVKSSTESNDVYGAWIKVCKAFCSERLVKAFEGLQKVHEFYGELTPEIKALREKLIERAKKSMEALKGGSELVNKINRVM